MTDFIKKDFNKEYPLWFALVALALAIFFWASAYVVIRVDIKEFSAGALGLFRYGVAALVMLVIYLFTPNKTRLDLKDFVLIFITGAIGLGLYNILVNQGEVSVPAGAASFIVSTMPVFSVIAACIFLKEKINFFGILGVFISFIGIILLSTSQHEEAVKISGVSNLAGITCLLLAVACAVFYGLMQKKLLKRFKAIELVCLSIFSAFLAQLIFLKDLAHEIAHASWIGLSLGIYLGVFPAALAYLGYTIALTRLSMIKANMSIFILPFIALLMGWIILGEKLSVLGLMGALLALAGPVLIHAVRLKKSY